MRLTQTALNTAITGTSTTAALVPAEPGEQMLVTCNTDMYIKFGGSGVAAASTSSFDVFLPAGAMIVLHFPSDQTHFRAISGGTDGVLCFQSVTDE